MRSTGAAPVAVGALVRRRGRGWLNPRSPSSSRPTPWVEALHRHCSDHGGARLRQLLVDPELALDEEYTTLVTGHRWPALTPALVEELHRHGRTVLGVWDRAEPESHALLVAVGVDGLVASDASPREIVDAITALARGDRPAADADRRSGRGARRTPDRRRWTDGCGFDRDRDRSRRALHALGRRSVLVDVDDVGSGVAPRLGLPLEPNICTAVDAVEYHTGALADAVIARSTSSTSSAGFPAPSGWTRLRPPEVLRVVHALARDYDADRPRRRRSGRLRTSSGDGRARARPAP